MTRQRFIQIAATVLLGGLFFASLLWLIKGDVFVSPDENAAFVFAKYWATHGSFRLPELLNIKLSGLLHPRSALGWGAAIVPVGFLGFPVLTGVVAALFGQWAMLLVTPLLAILAIVAWRQVAFKIFGNATLANLAAFFLALHPAFWYYSGRVMMQNVAFLAFLIFALWFATKDKRQLFFTGLCLGLAIFIRTSEALWIVPVTWVLFFSMRSRFKIQDSSSETRSAGHLYLVSCIWDLGSLLAGVGLVTLVMFAQNQATFGDPLTFGYIAHFDYPSLIAPVLPTTAQITAETWTNPLLPFGFHEMNILYNVRDYIFLLYPWMTVPAVIGLFAVLVSKTRKDRRWQIIIGVSTIIAIVLIAVYGSWFTADNPDPSIISLGNSHVRYWLPLFALGSLFAAYALECLLRKQRVLAYVMLGAIAVLSAHLVFFGPDGFVMSRQALGTFVEKRAKVLAATEDNAVIVVDRADKYLFPYRRVVVPLRNDTTYAALPLMVQTVPVYYFGITFPIQDLDYLNNVKLAADQLKIEQVFTVDDESLYSITQQP